MTSRSAFPPGVRIPDGTGPSWPGAEPVPGDARRSTARRTVLLGSLVAVLGAAGAVVLALAGLRTDTVTTVIGSTSLVHLSPGWLTGAAGAALVAGVAAVLAVTALVRLRASRTGAGSGSGATVVAAAGSVAVPGGSR